VTISFSNNILHHRESKKYWRLFGRGTTQNLEQELDFSLPTNTKNKDNRLYILTPKE
jgi:hypothetical protein